VHIACHVDLHLLLSILYGLRILQVLYLGDNQLHELPPGVFSSMTSLRSHVVFVCNENVYILGDTSAQAALILGGDVCYLASVC
jgi:hypothetical protein